MDIKKKRWTHLGLGAALMTTTALAGCGEPAAKDAAAQIWVLLQLEKTMR